MEDKKTMVEVTGLWVKKDSKGQEFFTGKMGRASILVFKNNYKKESSHPDYKMYITEPKAKDEKESEPSFDSSSEIPF